MTVADEAKGVGEDVESQPLLRQPPTTRNRLAVSSTTLIIIYYALCSSLMLIVNKAAIHLIPAPMSILCIQLLVSVVVVVIGDRAGVMVADNLEWAKVSKFIWVVIGFLGTLLANIKVLQNANVETFVTFRSSTPLVLSLCDYIWLGRALPSARSWSCLLVLLAGSLGYVAVDADFRVQAYYWLAAWYVFFTFDTVYAKHMCDTLVMTNWGRVYYANLLALLPLLVAVPLMGEPAVLAGLSWGGGRVAVLALSCALGVGMSHASYLLREAVSATAFTIVGILCKVLTVIINVMLWDKHASPAGIGFLLISVFAGTFYQQAPRRKEAAVTVTAST
ncbi:hypothetical protein Agub_g3883 [Astrephomene gubernaculifera]|uniref:Sugar phosphate transporter domain-containing protein n=1 Tax=Astrephomene gubernaculifera TaxID=47775 RepID=A0AAD3HJI2_9CHLO|nr:hypothetical protein Agub_g3883 [Astrephomene gubernaculifera]